MPFRSVLRALLRIGAPLVLLSTCSSPESEFPADPPGPGGEDAGPQDAGGPDATEGNGGKGGGDGPGAVRAPAPLEPTRYPHAALHSPMSKAVVDRLKAVLATTKGRPGVVAKVGDSLTVNSYFLGCFVGDDVRLGAYAHLEPTLAYFGATRADPRHSSYDRATLAAKVCWSSRHIVSGNPSPLDQELAFINPAFAVVLIGTNDTFPQGPELLDEKLNKIIDVSLARGVTPLLTTLPQRTDTAEAEGLVPEMNTVIRAIAQARQLPLMDLFEALKDAPNHGLRNDGVHLQHHLVGTAHGCWFDEQGLQKGINRRNLLTLEALDRVRRFIIEDEAPEKAPPPLAGEGTWQSPYEIDAFPFADDKDATKSQTSEVRAYRCSTAYESGPEVVYRMSLKETMTLRARLFHGPGLDMDLHFMNSPGGGQHCTARGDKVLEVTAGPGTYYLSADTFMAGDKPQSGDYRLTIVRLR